MHGKSSSPARVSGDDELVLGEEPLVHAGGRAEQAPRPEPAGEIPFAAVDQRARVEAAANLDHRSARHRLTGEFHHAAQYPGSNAKAHHRAAEFAETAFTKPKKLCALCGSAVRSCFSSRAAAPRGGPGRPAGP